MTKSNQESVQIQANGNSWELNNFGVAIDGVSGALAGAFCTMLFQPIENASVRLQNYETEVVEVDLGKLSAYQILESNFSFSLIRQQPKPALGEMKYLAQILRKEGVLAFYKGTRMAIIGAIFAYGLYFFFYRMGKNVLHAKTGVIGTFEILVATAFAAVITSVLTNPIWIIQTRMCWDESGKKTIAVHAEEIIKEGGIGAFWKGVLPSLLLILNPIITFWIYEYLKGIYVQDSDHPSHSVILYTSLISKLIATIATYPLLTLKTKAFTTTTELDYYSLVINFIDREGWRGLYRGIGPKIIMTWAYNSSMMLAFEEIRYLLNVLFWWL